MRGMSLGRMRAGSCSTVMLTRAQGQQRVEHACDRYGLGRSRCCRPRPARRCSSARSIGAHHVAHVGEIALRRQVAHAQHGGLRGPPRSRRSAWQKSGTTKPGSWRGPMWLKGRTRTTGSVWLRIVLQAHKVLRHLADGVGVERAAGAYPHRPAGRRASRGHTRPPSRRPGCAASAASSVTARSRFSWAMMLLTAACAAGSLQERRDRGLRGEVEDRVRRRLVQQRWRTAGIVRAGRPERRVQRSSDAARDCAVLPRGAG